MPTILTNIQQPAFNEGKVCTGERWTADGQPDVVGPVNNRPSKDQLQHFFKRKRKKWERKM